MADWLVTRAWIHAHKAGGGGWCKAQLDAIGVPWPPKKGWTFTAQGRLISETQRRAFEENRTATKRTLPWEPER